MPGWGATLYPSGAFTLWRQNGSKTNGFKESFVSAGKGILRGKSLSEMQEVYGTETVHRWWNAAADVDMPRVRPYPASPVNACLIDGWKNLVCDLGSSTPANSRKTKRGYRGLTSRGKNLVREAAIGLETRYGKKRLTFWTVTLPHMTDEDYRNVCSNWSAVCKSLKEKIIYRLKEAGLPTHVVAVTEMQPKRWENHGVPAWHLHLVFVGCPSTGGWVIQPEEADNMWSSTVEKWCSNPYVWRSSSKLERIKKSVGRYLSKYLSKGVSVIDAVEEMWPGCIPSSWYICTKSLRSWVDTSTRKGESIASWLYQLIHDSASEIGGLWSHRIEIRPGQHLAVCWMGTIQGMPPPDVALPDG